MRSTSFPRNILLLGCLSLMACAALLLVFVVGYFVLEREATPVAETAVLQPTAILPTLPTTTAPPPTAAPTLTIPFARPSFSDGQTSKLQGTPTPTPFPTLAVNPPPVIDQRPIPPVATADLAALLAATYPIHNYFDAAQRLALLELGSRTVTKPAYQVGDRETFFVTEGSVDATLLAATDHAYFWVEDGLLLDEAELFLAASQFEAYYFPLVRDLFGDVWLPGVDNDPRLSVLHLNDVNSVDELGYFTDLDEYPRTLYSDSNEREMVYLNMSQLALNDDLYFGTLVHELQHLTQWHVDANEATWFNEGLSQLAELHVGLDTVDVAAYLEAPEVPLTSWSYEEPLIDAHYASSYLFLAYVWEQLGETAVRELVQHPANGLASLWHLLPRYDARSLSQFVLDWAVATYLDDPVVGAAYGYTSLSLERPFAQNQVSTPPYETTATLEPFGTHYIELDYQGVTTITFVGDTVVNLLGEPTGKRGLVWYAPDNNEVNSQLTAVFDLRSLDTATLTFDAWYDLEADWDFAYLSVSSDGGTTWQIVETVHSVEGTYGPAFNGQSSQAPDAVAGWITETVYLDAYVGQEVWLRFELLTDASGPSRGFAIDNIRLNELNYLHDVDSGIGEWTAVGFVPIHAQLPQQWGVAIIQHGNQPQVTPLPLNPFNQGQWSVELGPSGGTLVVIPLTPFTRAPANYWLKLQ